MRTLHPRLGPTLLALFVAGVCVRLGIWQLDRFEQSRARTEQITSAWSLPPLVGLPTEAAGLDHRRVVLTGRWVAGTSNLASGGLVGGQPGYQLVTMLEQRDGTRVLVDRGWVPVTLTAEAARALESAPVPAEPGLILPVPPSPSTPSVPQVAAGDVPKWPLDSDVAFGFLPRVIGPPYAAMSQAALGPADPRVVVQLGPPIEEGQDRTVGPIPVGGYLLPVPRIHHLSYAAQWFGFAALAAAAWAWVSTRPRERR